MMTQHPSRSENYGIPHTHALQSTGDLGGLGAGSEILCFCSQGAYTPLGEREREKNRILQNQVEKSKQFMQALGLEGPMTGLSVDIVTREPDIHRKKERKRTPLASECEN